MTLTLNEEIERKSEKLAKQLARYRIDARNYYRGPIAPELFAINIANRQIRAWTGQADVDVIGDRTVRQAVLTVNENRRSITRTYQVHTSSPNADIVFRHFPIRIPEAKLGDWKVVRYPQSSYDHNHVVEATMTAPKTSMSLLVGFDEVRQFIAQLPKRVTSIDAAHRALLPPGGARKGMLRQGEWFFVPVTADERIAIEASIARGGRFGTAIDRALESSSSHHGPSIRVDGRTYAKGTIRDNRGARHAPLQLDDWYRVVRNNEVVSPTASHQRVRMWD